MDDFREKFWRKSDMNYHSSIRKTLKIWHSHSAQTALVLGLQISVQTSYLVPSKLTTGLSRSGKCWAHCNKQWNWSKYQNLLDGIVHLHICDNAFMHIANATQNLLWKCKWDVTNHLFSWLWLGSFSDFTMFMNWERK